MFQRCSSCSHRPSHTGVVCRKHSQTHLWSPKATVPAQSPPLSRHEPYLVRADGGLGTPLSAHCSFVLHLFVFTNCLPPRTYRDAPSETRTILDSVRTALSESRIVSRVQTKVAQRQPEPRRARRARTATLSNGGSSLALVGHRNALGTHSQQPWISGGCDSPFLLHAPFHPRSYP